MAKPEIHIRHVPREKDELILSWIAARQAGVSAYRIAKEAGINNGIVSMSTNAVKKADAEESGEDVAEFYW